MVLAEVLGVVDVMPDPLDPMAGEPGTRVCDPVGVVGTYLQQSHTAVVLLTVHVIAFAVGEFSTTLRLRRGARHAHLLGELVFRILFFGGILMLPLGASLARAALIPGGGSRSS